jgi:hypothetical protein
MFSLWRKEGLAVERSGSGLRDQPRLLRELRKADSFAADISRKGSWDLDVEFCRC